MFTRVNSLYRYLNILVTIKYFYLINDFKYNLLALNVGTCTYL